MRTVAGSHAGSAASAAARGFSLTIAMSARYGGAKSRESETAPMSACRVRVRVRDRVTVRVRV